MEWKRHYWTQSFLERNEWNFFKRRKFTQVGIYTFFCFLPYFSIEEPLSLLFILFPLILHCFSPDRFYGLHIVRRNQVVYVCAPIYLWRTCLKSLVIFYIQKGLSCSIGPTFINHKKKMSSQNVNSTWGRLALSCSSLLNRMKLKQQKDSRSQKEEEGAEQKPQDLRNDNPVSFLGFFFSPFSFLLSKGTIKVSLGQLLADDFAS